MRRIRPPAGSLRRPPSPVPEIGDEYAAGRALAELARQLLHAGRTDATANEP
ncbi:dsRBD fold-containing protein [Kitasatospora sp. NPDC096204]|uniref:dsRBD fold-containing protein n=1 Tax=Kitasatospora sp. NPDC096204 TaxID=3364094 RepID=UPI0037FD6C06